MLFDELLQELTLPEAAGGRERRQTHLRNWTRSLIQTWVRCCAFSCRMRMSDRSRTGIFRRNIFFLSARVSVSSSHFCLDCITSRKFSERNAETAERREREKEFVELRKGEYFFGIFRIVLKLNYAIWFLWYNYGILNRLRVHCCHSEYCLSRKGEKIV